MALDTRTQGARRSNKGLSRLRPCASLQAIPEILSKHASAGVQGATRLTALINLFVMQMEIVSMHNALLLLGEDTSSSTAQRGQKGPKRVKGGAAKIGNKGKKPAAPIKSTEEKHGGLAKVHILRAFVGHLAVYTARASR